VKSGSAVGQKIRGVTKYMKFTNVKKKNHAITGGLAGGIAGGLAGGFGLGILEAVLLGVASFIIIEVITYLPTGDETEPDSKGGSDKRY